MYENKFLFLIDSRKWALKRLLKTLAWRRRKNVGVDSPGETVEFHGDSGYLIAPMQFWKLRSVKSSFNMSQA